MTDLRDEFERRIAGSAPRIDDRRRDEMLYQAGMAAGRRAARRTTLLACGITGLTSAASVAAILLGSVISPLAQPPAESGSPGPMTGAGGSAGMLARQSPEPTDGGGTFRGGPDSVEPGSVEPDGAHSDGGTPDHQMATEVDRLALDQALTSVGAVRGSSDWRPSDGVATSVRVTSEREPFSESDRHVLRAGYGLSTWDF